VHADAAMCQGERDAAGADAELECRAIAGDLGEEVDIGSTTAGSESSAVAWS